MDWLKTPIHLTSFVTYLVSDFQTANKGTNGTDRTNCIILGQIGQIGQKG